MPRRVARPRSSAWQTSASAAVGARRPRRPGSGSRGRCVRSKRSVSASRSVSATASGWSAKRAAIASGVASTWPWLPRRRGSEASSVVCSRMATKRVLQPRAGGRVGVDVARGHARHPEALGQGGQAAVQRAVVAVEGALELDPERVAPEGAQQPAHASARRARRGARSRSGRPAPRRGPRRRQRDPRAVRDARARERAPSAPPLGGVHARVRVRAREQPAEVAPSPARRGPAG